MSIYILYTSIYITNHIGGVMVGVLALSAVNHRFELKQKTIELVFVGSPLSTQHKMGKSKDWLVRIRIMWQSGTTCLFAECCFSELAL